MQNVLRCGRRQWHTRLPFCFDRRAAAAHPRLEFTRCFASQSAEVEHKLNIFVGDLDATLEAHRRWNHKNSYRYAVSDADSFVASTQEVSEELQTRSNPLDSMDKAHKLQPEDYRGEVKPLQPEWVPRGDLDDAFRRPWLTYLPDDAPVSAHQLLSLELQAFSSYMDLTVEERVAGRLIRNEVYGVLGPNLSVKTVGSRDRGLASPLSDLDLNVSQISLIKGAASGSSSKESGRARSKRGEITMLRKWRKQLRTIAHDPEIRYGRIPLLKMTHTATGITIQIKNAIPTDLQEEFIGEYRQNLPFLRPVFLALRHCLQMRGLATVFEGGLGSYCLLMMTAGAMNILAEQLKTKDLGEVFLQVVEYWSHFDCYQHGFIVEPPSIFMKSNIVARDTADNEVSPQLVALKKLQNPNPGPSYLLCLQDPADFSNDLGKNSHSIKHIQETLRKLHDDSMQMIEKFQCSSQNELAQTDGVSILAPFVEGNYFKLEQQRGMLERRIRKNTQKFNRPGFHPLPRGGKHTISDESLKEKMEQRMKSQRASIGNRAEASKAKIAKSIQKHQMGDNFFRLRRVKIDAPERILSPQHGTTESGEEFTLRKIGSDSPEGTVSAQSDIVQEDDEAGRMM